MLDLTHAAALSDAFAFAPDPNGAWARIVGFLSDPWSKDHWEWAMNALKIGLTLGGAMLLLYELRADRMGEWLDERRRRAIAITMAALAFGAYFSFFNPNVRYVEYYHRHELFHYYLGSKYFEELGYTRIYECAAAAEMELGRAQQVKNRELRDLRVNLIRKNSDPEVQAHIEECRQIFAKNPARWEAYKKDVDWFYHSSAGSYWDNMQKDHGFNPPPVWTMGGKLFASLGTAGENDKPSRFFLALSGIDVAMHLGAVLLLFWAFGWRTGAVATIWWGCNAPADFYWTGGAFLRMDWFFFLVAAICLARKRKFELAGAALTWSSLLRVFPVLLFAGWGAIIAIRTFMKWRKGTPLMECLHPDHRRLIGGCIVAVGVLVPLSMAVTTGPQAYAEFAHHTLGTHNTTPLTNHMGLKTIMVHDWDGRMRFTRDDNLDDPFQGWKQGRIDRANAQKWVRHGIEAFICLWIVWVLRRTRLLWVGLAVSVPLAMCLVELTCYYYSVFIVAAVLTKLKREWGAVALLVSGASQILALNYFWVDDKFTAQAWLFMLFSVMMLWAFSRPFSLERLSAWWNGKPEPRSAKASRPLQAAATPAR